MSKKSSRKSFAFEEETMDFSNIHFFFLNFPSAAFDGPCGGTEGPLVQLYLKQEAELRYFKACLVPYATRETIEEKLTRLQASFHRLNTLSDLDHSVAISNWLPTLPF